MREGSDFDRLRRDLDEPVEAPSDVPERIGRYPVLREISRTGLSVVYLARDPDLGRHVVIKVLREDCTPPEFLRRFQREGQLTASLRHPGIVTIHEVGTADLGTGRPVPFIAMDYLEGGTLVGMRLPFFEAARTLAAVAEAVEHAHKGGIVHRDLKPGNILLDRDGRPVVTDFGLAKVSDGRTALTVQGTILGTPQYMAPEQISGDPDAVDARSDVYALGAILYEVLAGAPPHSDPNTAALFQKILHEEPPRPAGGLPRDLEAVAMKALEKEPARRYATAGAFAADLRHYLAGKPIAARAPGTVRRLLRKAGRHRAAMLPTIALAVVLLGLAGWAILAALGRHMELMEWSAAARHFETAGDVVAARDAWRKVLDLDPANPEAMEGYELADAEFQARSRAKTASSAELAARRSPEPWAGIGDSFDLGGVSHTPLSSLQASLVLDAADRPIVAWRDMMHVGPDEIYLKRWDGSAWIELAGSATGGGVSAAPGFSRLPTLTRGAGEDLWLAWDDNRGGPVKIYVRRWDGRAWGEPLGFTGTPGNSEYPRLAVGGSGLPVLAWHEETATGYETYVMRFDGRSWTELGGSGSGGGISQSPGASHRPVVAVDPGGNPVVAWQEEVEKSGEIYLKRWDGSRWVELGGSASGGGLSRTSAYSAAAALVLDPSGRPVVAWHEGKEIWLRRWNGSEWEELGGSGSGGGISGTPGDSIYPSLALDREGRPVVAWQDSTPGFPCIYMKRWDGGAWIEIGKSASGTGISAGVFNTLPSLALTAAGNPVVAWDWVQRADITEEIVLRTWSEEAPFDLAQRRGAKEVAAGGTLDGSSIVLAGTVFTTLAGQRVRLEVELRAAGTPWTGTPTSMSDLVESGREARVTLRNLAPGAWRWQARTADALGMVSRWVPFGVSGPDFSARRAPGP